MSVNRLKQESEGAFKPSIFNPNGKVDKESLDQLASILVPSQGGNKIAKVSTKTGWTVGVSVDTRTMFSADFEQVLSELVKYTIAQAVQQTDISTPEKLLNAIAHNPIDKAITEIRRIVSETADRATSNFLKKMVDNGELSAETMQKFMKNMANGG